MPADLPRLTRPEGPRPGVGIVHLGLGAFFRAHGALYVAEAMARSGGDWGIVGVSLVRPDQRDRLAPQGFAYTALELGPEGETARVVDVVAGRAGRAGGPRGGARGDGRSGRPDRHADRHREGLLPRPGHRPAEPRRIPTSSTTSPTPSAALGPRLPRPRARAPARGGRAPFTVLCCDNLPDNGATVRGVVLELAGLIDPALADVDRRRGGVSLHDGRPHRAGDQARGHRARRGADRPARPLAGDARAVPPVGGRGPFRRRRPSRPRRGRGAARRATCAPSS